MAITIEPFEDEHKPAVREFNARMRGALEPGMELMENPELEWLPKGGHPRIYQEMFLALEDGVVRGGYVLKHQNFALNGETVRAACYRSPISEGMVNRAYASIGFLLQRHALEQQPRLFSLGMGSLGSPLAKTQKAFRWGQYTVPFCFRVVRGGKFVRHIVPLRSTPARRVLGTLAALTGIAAMGSAAYRMARPLKIPAGVIVEHVRGFEAWADELWERSRGKYRLIAVRDADIANALYPASSERFLCWRVSVGGRVAGWIVALDTQMEAHKQFGDMRLGTIVDGLATPEDAGIVLAAAARELEQRVDLIVSNQMHEAWSRGLKDAGFLSGPSNFIFSASKELCEGLAPFEEGVRMGHVNRGDGDGPIHL